MYNQKLVLTVTPKPPTKVSTPVTICSGETYTWCERVLFKLGQPTKN
jgi:hypothetical protein